MSLPKNWKETPLIELLETLETGSRPKGGVSGILSGVPSLGGEHLNYDGGFNLDKIKYIPEHFANKMNRGLIKPRDVLIVKDGATTGKVSFVDENFPFVKAYVNEHVFICRIVSDVYSKCVYYYLRSKEGQERILDNFTGSAQGGINQKFAHKTIIPVPPLGEQKGIVAKLDKLFAHLDQLKARLEQVPVLLKQFRQAVLTQAVTGKLTEEWRQKNECIDAKQIFTSIQKHLDEYYSKSKLRDQRKNKKSTPHDFVSPNIPNTWQFYRVEDVSYLVTDGTHKTPKYQTNGIKFLSVKNVRPFKILDNDVKYITPKEHEEINGRCNPEQGDILYTKVGATFGYACVNELKYPFSIFVSLALVKTIQKFFDPKYFEIVFNSELVYRQAAERVTGIGTPDLHLIEIRDFKIPVCSLKEQMEIVSRVKSLFILADKIEASYNIVKGKIDQLPKAILAKAFRGELVEQDELAKVKKYKNELNNLAIAAEP